MAVEEVGTIAQIEAGTYPLENIGFFSIKLDVVPGTGFRVITQGHTVYVDWDDGSGISSGTNPAHEYTNTDTVEPVVLSLKSFSGLDDIRIDFDVPAKSPSVPSAVAYLDSVDLSVLTEVQRLYVRENQNMSYNGRLVGSRLPSVTDRVRIESRSQGRWGDVVLADVPGGSRDVLLQGTDVDDDVSNLPDNNYIVLDFTGSSAMSGTVASGEVGSATKRIVTYKSGVGVDFSRSSGIAGDAPELRYIRCANAPKVGPINEMLEECRKLETVLSSGGPLNEGDLSGTYNGDPILPPSIKQARLGLHDYDGGVTDLSNHTNLERLDQNYRSKKSNSFTYWTDNNGNSWMGKTVNEIHAQMGSGISDGVYFDLAELKDYQDAVINTMTQDEQFKMVGLGTHHPANGGVGLRDHDHEIRNLSQYWLSVTIVDGDTVEADITEKYTNYQNGYRRDSSGTLELRTLQAGSEVWVPMFQDGEQFRLDYGDGSTELFEIASSSYDANNDLITVNIETSPNVTGASGSIDTNKTADRLGYAVYFDSTT